MSATSLKGKIKAGDTVIIREWYQDFQNRDPKTRAVPWVFTDTEKVVTRVGRSYAYTAGRWADTETAYHLDTGWGKGEAWPGRENRMFTKETRAAWDRREMAKAVVNGHIRRDTYGWVNKLPLEDLEAVAEILARQDILAQAGSVLRADGHVYLANRVESRADAIHEEIRRREETTK